MVSTRARAPPAPQTIPDARKSTRKPQPELGEYRLKETINITQNMMGFVATKYFLAATFKFGQWLKLLPTVDTPIVHSHLPTALTERAEQARPVRSRKRRRFGSPSRTEDPSAVHTSNSCQTLSQSSPKSERPSSKDQGQGHAEQLPSSEHAVRLKTQAADIRRPENGYNNEIAVTSYHGFSVGSRENDCSSGVHSETRTSPAAMAPASLQLRISSLPILDNLATQIMEIFIQHTLPDLLVFSRGQECQISQTFTTLSNLFCQTKRVYADDRGFLPLFGNDLTEASQIRTIRNANTATFFSIIFHGKGVDFQALLDYFLDTMIVENTNFTDEHSELLVETLTQACISDIGKGQELCSDTLAKRFSFNPLPSRLDRGATSKSREHTNRGHTKRLGSRRNTLLQLMESEDSATTLRQKYPWEAFLGFWHTYLQTNLDALKEQDNLKVAGACTVKPLRSLQKQRPQQETQQTQNHTFEALPLIGSCGRHETHSHATSNDIIEKAARAAQFAIDSYGDHHKANSNYEAFSQEPQHNQHLKKDQSFDAPGPPIQFHFEYGLHPEVAVADCSYLNNSPFQEPWPSDANVERSLNCVCEEEDTIPYPTQSAPTRVLYERARLAAASKPASHTPRKASTSGSTQRRPWTSEEEHALMAGLDRVKGPHWSQIHAMFGPSGNINKSLKDRSQVQMKDKARNLKLFFLKSNIEVPYYLQFVTGELKTRAPSRALKQQIKEKQVTDEDRTHASGITTLTGSTAQKDVRGDESPPKHRLPRELAQNDAFRESGLTPDDNIDPSLGALSPLPRDHRASDALHAGMPYQVPTPNMIMQNLDRCTGLSGVNASSRLQCDQH